MAGESPDFLARGDVPKADDIAPAGAGQGLVVGGKGKAIDIPNAAKSQRPHPGQGAGRQGIAIKINAASIQTINHRSARPSRPLLAWSPDWSLSSGRQRVPSH